MPELLTRWIGVDVTTTEMALAVSDGQREGFAALKMRGATNWKSDPALPAFDLSFVADMLGELLETLRGEGWQFHQPGSLSLACRQHDMAVLGKDGNPLLPALSWQCNVAVEETRSLNGNRQVTDAVGPVEERFILPKLAWVLKAEPALKERIGGVMTTGDWILGQLSGSYRLSTSDALSNGLLDQRTRELAREVLSLAGIDPEWFPEVIQSGHRVGGVRSTSATGQWSQVCEILRGWQVVASLGDNHASALGCGMTDERTLVVSAGTSGTINLARPAGAPLNEVAEPAVRFEFYRHHSLLLRMLAHCGDWYNRFLDEFGGDLADAHWLLNELARQAELGKLQRVECDVRGECYRPGWTRLSLPAKLASVQCSIALELLLHVKKMLSEVPDGRQQLDRYVLTGGLSQSTLFQQAFRAGIELLDPGKEVMVSGRAGPLRYKTSAYGALLNARMPEWEHDLKNIPDSLFPVIECASPEGPADAKLRQLLESEL